MTLASTINLNATTPSPAAGHQNVAVATDSATPTANISFTDPVMVGDSGSGGTAGNVPAPPAGSAAAGKVLKAVGSFPVPTGGGITALTGDVTASGSGSVAATAVKIPPGVTLTGTPTTGQVPTATGSTAATWQTPGGGGSLDVNGSPVSSPNLQNSATVTFSVSGSNIQATAAGGGGGVLTQIGQVVVAVATGSISFTSIPGTYSSLELEISGLSSTLSNIDEIMMQLNGDTGSNYSWGILFGGQISPTANTAASANAMLIAYINNLSDSATVVNVNLPGYAALIFIKSLIATSNFENGGGNICAMTAAGVWRNTAAINAITLFQNGGGNFVAGTIVTLYGKQ